MGDRCACRAVYPANTRLVAQRIWGGTSHASAHWALPGRSPCPGWAERPKRRPPSTRTGRLQQLSRSIQARLSQSGDTAGCHAVFTRKSYGRHWVRARRPTTLARRKGTRAGTITPGSDDRWTSCPLWLAATFP